jgi:hypothetical protein
MNCGWRIEESCSGPPGLRLPPQACAGRLYKQTQSGVPDREKARDRVETKPIGWQCHVGRGPVAQTNPLLARSISRTSAVPTRTCNASDAGIAPMLLTGRMPELRTPYGVTANRPTAPNKPNFAGWAGHRRAKCAKQSQFLPPVEEVGRERPIHEEATMRNKAKLGQDGTSGGWARQERANHAKQTQLGPSVPNTANSSTAGYDARVREAGRRCGRVRANPYYDRTLGGEAKSYWVPKHQAV